MKTTVDQLYIDIWQYVFEYFSVNELYFTFVNFTNAVDEILIKNRSQCLFRKLILDTFVHTLPEKLDLNQVNALELHQESPLDIVEHCTALCSLKLIGDSDWIVSILAKVFNAKIKIKQLVLITPGVGSFDRILDSAASIFSLFRLEIYANDVEEEMEKNISLVNQTSIRQFTLHSCSSISWHDLSYMLPCLLNIQFLDITLSRERRTISSSFTFPKLRYIRLMLHELSFKLVLNLLITAPLLNKLKLNGLVDDEEFLVTHKWISLFQLCSSLEIVTVRLSLEENSNLFCKEIIQKNLSQINLNLKCLGDDNDYYITGREEQQRWWKLSGLITKHHILPEKK